MFIFVLIEVTVYRCKPADTLRRASQLSTRVPTTMMKRFLSVMLLSLTVLSVAAFDSRLLGDLEMRLRSRSKTDVSQLLLEVLTVTVNFLDLRFEELYSSKTAVDFDKVSLSALSYNIDEVNGGFVAEIVFKGRAFFADGKAADQHDVIAISKDVFQMENQAYLEALMLSNDPFLTDISYAIVNVGGDVEAENQDVLSKRPIDSIAPPSEDDTFFQGLNKWTIITLAGAGGFLTVCLVCLLWCCCSSIADDTPMAMPDTVKPNETKGTQDEESYMPETKAPSPLRSITSQDSSVFTYNPKSCRSTDSRTLGSLLTSNPTMEMDLEAWKRGSTVQKGVVPFGHDISAIENKKDLSLIEEGSEGEEATPDKARLGRFKPSGYTLTERSLHELDRSEMQTIPRNRSSSSSRSSSQSRNRNSRRSQPIDLEADAAEVIKDLKDLSFQIDRYRRN